MYKTSCEADHLPTKHLLQRFTSTNERRPKTKDIDNGLLQFSNIEETERGKRNFKEVYLV